MTSLQRMRLRILKANQKLVNTPESIFRDKIESLKVRLAKTSLELHQENYDEDYNGNKILAKLTEAEILEREIRYTENKINRRNGLLDKLAQTGKLI